MNFFPSNLQRRRRAQCAALACAAAIMLVPANLLPVLRTNLSGRVRTDTIFSGIVGLCEDGNWAIGAIVFVASILIPALKLVGLATLLFATRRGAPAHAHGLTRLFALLDFIGRWSMLDVFLAGFLAGVVRFGALANIEPRSGIAAFAAAVVLTVLATATFDPRSLWPAAAERLAA
ncbi:MAG TPA: paraquat-inducible protein A [Opitutaceae bacterium]|nr:paraquat-inducible protein A [Opitutaceae bacterium]